MNRDKSDSQHFGKQITRRWFIEQCGVGMGALALNHLLTTAGYAQQADLTGNGEKNPRLSH